MKTEISKKTLTVNYLSDDMIKCAIGKGFKIPIVSIKHHYKKMAQFIKNYKKGIIINYELNILDNKGKTEAIYLIEAV